MRSVTVALAITAFIVIMAAVIYHRPYLRGIRILPAGSHPQVTQYAQEFAESLSVSTYQYYGERHIYLPGGERTSPDGRFTLRQSELRNSYHKITLSRGQGTHPEIVLVLQEGDPGSGTSHNLQWSRDSEAVFIYGSGKPAGRAHANNLALVYLVEQRLLYSIDLAPYLAKRLNAEK